MICFYIGVENMKHFLSKYLLVIIFVIILGAIGTPILRWHLMDGTPLQIYLLNKTVPDASIREHKGFGWLVNYLKYLNKDGSEFDYNNDYFGFYPDNTETQVKDLPLSIADAQLIYIADTYGVYADDLGLDETTSGPSKIVYGGLNLEDIRKVREALLKNNATLIAEFNTFGSPTSKQARKEMSDMLGVDWTGWIGRYFLDLSQSNEIPNWAVKNYVEQYDTAWTFEGSGFVFVHESGKIVVLREGIETGEFGCRIKFNEGGVSELGLDSQVNYNYWFDVIELREGIEALAEFELDLLEPGKVMLKDSGLIDHFPAITKNMNELYTAYYFTGDFNDIPTVPGYYKFLGYDLLRKWVSISTTRSNEAFYWKIYVPAMKRIMSTIKIKDVVIKEPEYVLINNTKINARLNDTYFEVFRNGQWEEILIKGVNIGMGKPGHFPGDAAITKDEYLRWLNYIGEMNANTIRVYTIHPPEFYEALYQYNMTAEEPIYVFQGIWVDEEGFLESENLFEDQLTEDIKVEIKRIVNVIHGNAVVEERKGHASGTYRYDVSDYVIGWVFGNEWDPSSVIRTNENNTSMVDQSYKYLETKDASPFEIWLASLMDYTLAYEYEQYQWQRPMSFTNWLTTDLLKHPSEPFKNEDKVGVDPNTIYTKDDFLPGYFGAYHIYPYYPDFINYDEVYAEYIDFRGEKNRYAGYLNDLLKAHRIPVIVAEFGLPSSRGVGRITNSGMDQGLHSETSQGEKSAKLFEDIISEDYAGGLLFVWQDEWFKKSWNIMEFDNKDRRAYWSNVQTFEEQYGLLGYETEVSTRILIDGKPTGWKEEEILMKETEATNNLATVEEKALDLKTIYVSHDVKYLYIGIQYNDLKDDSVWDQMETAVVIDTISNQGIKNLPSVDYKTWGDFVIKISGEENSQLLVDSYYDMNNYLYGHIFRVIDSPNYAELKYNNEMHVVNYMIRAKVLIPSQNRYVPAEVHEAGKLTHGNGDFKSNDYNSLTDFNINYETNMIEMRIPWMLMNFKDPSTREIMGDFWKDGLTSSEVIEDINLSVLTYNPNAQEDLKSVVDHLPEKNTQISSHLYAQYSWEKWEEVSAIERLKQSYYIFKNLFEKYN